MKDNRDFYIVNCAVNFSLVSFFCKLRICDDIVRIQITLRVPQEPLLPLFYTHYKFYRCLLHKMQNDSHTIEAETLLMQLGDSATREY